MPFVPFYNQLMCPADHVNVIICIKLTHNVAPKEVPSPPWAYSPSLSICRENTNTYYLVLIHNLFPALMLAILHISQTFQDNLQLSLFLGQITRLKTKAITSPLFTSTSHWTENVIISNGKYLKTCRNWLSIVLQDLGQINNSVALILQLDHIIRHISILANTNLVLIFEK